MSFPSSIRFRDDEGMSAREALYKAIQVDTPKGYAYVRALAGIVKEEIPVDQAVAYVQRFVPEEDHEDILRAERTMSGGIKVDVAPDSRLGKQVSRLLGTGPAHRLLQEEFDISFGLVNCCGGVGGKDKKNIFVTFDEQVNWQGSIDC